MKVEGACHCGAIAVAGEIDPEQVTPIYSTTPGQDRQQSYMLRAGILKERDQLTPRQQIWFRSARPWVTDIGGVPRDEREPSRSHLR